MTNGEINLEVALKAKELGLLNSYESNFIEDIKDFDKKQLRKLSGKQYRLLKAISDKYEDEIE